MNKSISYTSILKVFLVIASVWFVYQILDVVAIVFFGLILSSVIAPMIDKMEIYNIPRILSGIIIYTLLITGIGLLLFLLVPPLAIEIANFTKQLPNLINQSTIFQSLINNNDLSSLRFLDQISDNLSQATSSLWAWVISLVGGIGNVIFVFVISFFLSVQDEGLKKLLRESLPLKSQNYVLRIISKSQKTLSQWLKGQLVLMLIVGLLTYIGLLFVDVPYKLSLAVLAGLFEIIPFIGPIIAAIPAVIFGLGTSLITGLVVLIVYFIIQRVENNVLVPYIMKWAVQMNTILVLVAILIGAKLGGVAGMLLSVPVLAIGIELAKTHFRTKRANVKNG